MSICGCAPIISPEQFIDGSAILYNQQLSPLFSPVADPDEVKALKDKVICEFQKIMSDLRKGIKPPLEFLLEEISAINLAEENSLNNSKFIIQYYLNNVERYLY